MDASHPLPFVVSLDDTDDPADVLDGLILGQVRRGPAAPCPHLAPRPRAPGRPLLPPGARAARVAVDGSSRAHLATGEGWTLRAARWRDDSARITVTAVTEELARSVLRDATRGAVHPARPAEEAVTVGFWHMDCRAPVHKQRQVDVAPWPRIRRNYSSAAARALEHLMAVRPGEVHGRLLLLNGPPGTGKTTVLRALAHAWRRWCRMEYVLDPEVLFANSGYLMAAALGDDEEEDRDRWRLLVLEDCDELIRADAKQGSGQALSRLLNLTDGLLGRGLDVLVAVTTNEPLGRLHPAVVRPGRCLAHVEVSPAVLGGGRRVARHGRGRRLRRGDARRAVRAALRRGDRAAGRPHPDRPLPARRNASQAELARGADRAPTGPAEPAGRRHSPWVL